MADAIIFKVTNAGKQALASGGAVLSHLAIGTGRHASTGDETQLVNEAARYAIISGGVEAISNVLRFSAEVFVSSAQSVFEVGVITDDGVLFAIASSNAAPFFTASPTQSLIASFGMLLTDSEAAGVTVASNNHNKPLAIMEAHLSPQDPHSQYLDVPRLQHLLDTALPIGYLYHTHIDMNPKPLFDELLGVETEWRRITGKIIVGADSNDRFVGTPRFTLGQEGMTTEAIGQQPSIYPLHTTHIWERIKPYEFLYDGKHNYDGSARYQ